MLLECLSVTVLTVTYVPVTSCHESGPNQCIALTAQPLLKLVSEPCGDGHERPPPAWPHGRMAASAAETQGRRPPGRVPAGRLGKKEDGTFEYAYATQHFHWSHSVFEVHFWCELCGAQGPSGLGYRNQTGTRNWDREVRPQPGPAVIASSDAACASVQRDPPRQELSMSRACQACSRTRGNGVGGKLLRCSRCNGPHYCSKACQVADWPAHKLQCQTLQLTASALGKDFRGRA